MSITVIPPPENFKKKYEECLNKFASASLDLHRSKRFLQEIIDSHLSGKELKRKVIDFLETLKDE